MGLSGYLFSWAGDLGVNRMIGAPIACSGNFALQSRFRFVLRLLCLGPPGRLVLLLLLPGEFALTLLEGEFCSCHSLPPLAFLSLRGSG